MCQATISWSFPSRVNASKEIGSLFLSSHWLQDSGHWLQVGARKNCGNQATGRPGGSFGFYQTMQRNLVLAFGVSSMLGCLAYPIWMLSACFGSSQGRF